MKTTLRTKVTIGAFAILLVSFFCLCVLVPADVQSMSNENRKAKPFPSLTVKSCSSGEFSKEFEEYLSDSIGFRSFFINISSYLERHKGFQAKSGTVTKVAKNIGLDVSVDEKNSLLITKDKIMEIFYRNRETEASYADTLNSYRETLPKSTRMISMLIPTQIEFEENRSLGDSQKEEVDFIYQNLDEDIVKINAYRALLNNKNEYIYFRTDHHWTQRGAFCAYTALSEQLYGVTPDIADYQTENHGSFLGSLYKQTNDKSVEKNPDTLIQFKKCENYDVACRAYENGAFVDYAACLYKNTDYGTPVDYGFFMCGDHPFAKITTQNQNGKTLLVIKDSYANALIPFLCENYETVLVIDPRNYSGTVSSLAEEYRIDDCLIIDYVFATTFSDFIGKLNEIL